MRPTLTTNPSPATLPGRIALWLVLLLPVALMYSRTAAEAMMAAVDVLFLANLTLRPAPEPSRTLRQFWFRATLAWWVWLMACSAVGVTGLHGLVQAAIAIRFPLFAAALAGWILTAAPARRALWLSISLAALWIGVECWQQYLTGSNVFGIPRAEDGALTGPFGVQRAAAALILIFFPAVLPWVVRLAESRPHGLGGRWPGALTGGLLLILSVATLVLIGQRMPTLLLVLGLVLTALLVPRLRVLALVALGVGAAVVAATPLISPPTFAKLVVKFWDQFSHFTQSPYGLLYIRAINITELHPWLGAGHDAFRALCNDPAAKLGLPEFGISAAAAEGREACNIHPHNFYMEAATAAGVPGLLLFMLAVGSWVTAVGRGLRCRSTLATALFVQLCVAMWPLASTSDFLSVPNVGWTFLVLGFGLAEARDVECAPAEVYPRQK